MIVDGTTIGLIGAGSLAAGLSTTLAVQKKFGIEVRTLNQKTLKQRSEEMQDRFKFGQPFQGSALFGAMSREQEERQREALMRSGLKISALMFWASKIICIAVGIMVGVLIGTKLSGLATIAAGGLGGMVGYILPELYLLQKRREWRNNIERELPNALDLMSISMAAGSTFDDAVRTVAENSEGALAEASATYWPTPASWISPMRSSSSPPMPACSRSPSSWPPLSRHARPEPSSSRCSRIRLRRCARIAGRSWRRKSTRSAPRCSFRSSS